MLISYYFPSEYPDQPFVHYAKSRFDVEFILNGCTADCDVIYCGTLSQLVKAYEASKQFQKKLLCWVWDVPIFSSAHMWGFNEKLPMLQECSKVFSASKFTQNLLRSYGIESEQFYGYVNSPVIASVTSQLKIPNRVVQVGRFTPIKHFDNTILAFMADPDIEVHLVGPGVSDPKYMRTLQMLATGLPNVHFIYGLEWPDVIREIKEASVLIAPSGFEGFGMTPIEAIFCETPPVVHDLEVYREVYGDKLLYCNGEDPESIRQATVKLLTDSKVRSKLLEQARPVVDQFTPEEYVKRWMAHIKAAL